MEISFNFYFDLDLIFNLMEGTVKSASPLVMTLHCLSDGMSVSLESDQILTTRICKFETRSDFQSRKKKFKLDWESIRSSPRDGFGVLGTRA